MAAASINALKNIGGALSSGGKAAEVQDAVQRLSDTLAESRRREKKLLAEVAVFEGQKIKADLAAGKSGFCHRPNDNLDFVNSVVFEVRDAVAEAGRAAVLVTGEDKSSGAVMIVGEEKEVDRLAAKVKEIVPTAKGGGRGGKWQGKVTTWGKGELKKLREAVQETAA